MVRQDIQRLHALFLAILLDLVAQHGLRSRLVQLWLENKTAALARFLQCPPREHSGNFRYIFLRVPAVHSQCVQLHELTGIVFVQSRVPFLLIWVGAIGLRPWLLRPRIWMHRHWTRTERPIDPAPLRSRLRCPPS